MPEYERKMPDFHPENRYLFITWRLHGSLPKPVLYGHHPTEDQAFAANDRALAADRNGPKWLEDPVIATVVANAIQHGADSRNFYELYGWVVMPNHVHVLILPLVSVPAITRWLEGSTAHVANQLL